MALSAGVTVVSDCARFQDPDDDVPEGDTLPLLPGSAPCAYSTISGSVPLPTTSTSTHTNGVIGYPFTSTAGNGAVVAYGTTSTNGYVFAAPLYTGPSTTIYYGKSMAVTLAPTSSVNVGTLTASPLFFAISSALMAACTDIPSNAPSVALTNTATTCGEVAPIQSIIWTDDEGNWGQDAELEVDIQAVSYFNLDGLLGIVTTIASALNASSTYKNNTWSPKQPYCTFEWCTENDLPGQEPSTVT